MVRSRHGRAGGCVTQRICGYGIVAVPQPSKLMKTGSIPATRSRNTLVAILHPSSNREGEQCRFSERYFTGFRLCPVYYLQALLAAIRLRIGIVPKSKM
jgi:hypothetical protein